MNKSNIELEALITEREGMLAENETRAKSNSSPAYGIEHFLELADRMRCLVPEVEGPHPDTRRLDFLEHHVHDLVCGDGDRWFCGFEAGLSTINLEPYDHLRTAIDRAMQKVDDENERGN